MRSLSKQWQVLKFAALSTLAGAALLAAIPVFADDGPSNAAGFAAMGAMMLFALVIGIAAYVYFALALQTIAKKTGAENAWWAWVPILQILLMLNIAGKPLWWIILFFIPIVGIVMMIITFMAVAEAVKKPSWWGILVIVPVFGLIVPGYLAWAD